MKVTISGNKLARYITNLYSSSHRSGGHRYSWGN